MKIYQAWTWIAERYESYHRDGNHNELSCIGLCMAILGMYNRDEIDRDTLSSMQKQINAVKPPYEEIRELGGHFWPVNRQHAAIRARYAREFAEQSKGSPGLLRT